MRGYKVTYFIFITMLEIATLVMGMDVGATNTLNGNQAPIDISNQDININQAILSSNFPQNSQNFAPDLYNEKGNHERNTREITNEDPISNLHSSLIQDNLMRKNTNRKAREVSDSRIDTNNFDTGSMFDTDTFNEDTEQETCIRENPDRKTRGVSESMISSNIILDSLKKPCHHENSNRNVRQVIDTNILNQKQQDLERDIPKELTSLNHVNVDENSEKQRNVREIFDESLAEKSELTVDQNDFPLNLNKLGISTNLAKKMFIGNSEENCDRNARDIDNIEPNMNQNFDVVESKQNLKNIDSNPGSEEDSHRIVRGIDNTHLIEPDITNRNLNNLESVGKIDGNNQRIVREVLIDETPMMGSSDIVKQDTLEENANEMGDLKNLQKLTDSDSFGSDENLKEIVRSTRDTVQGSQMDLNKDLAQNTNKITVVDDKYLGIPPNLVSNSGGILNENIERNSRAIKGYSVIESDVLNQNMDVNEGENVGNAQIIVGAEVLRKSRQVQESSLIDSDVSNRYNSVKEDNENNQRIVREASNVGENVENESFGRNTRGISEEKISRTNILGENAFNLGSNSDKLEDLPENLDPAIFNDDESLVDDINIRSIRDISEKRLSKDESDLDENGENFERKAREINDMSGKLCVNEAQTLDEHRAVRNIPDFNDKSNSEVSNEEDQIVDSKNTIEISELSGTSDLKVYDGGDNIEENRFVRDIPMEYRTPRNVFNQGNVDQLRNIREISGDNQMVDSVSNGDDRNIRDVSVNNEDDRNIKDNYVTNGDNRNTRDVTNGDDRNIRDIPVEHRTSLSNVLNQDSTNNELRSIRETSEGSNHDFSNQEAARNIREISLKNPSLNSNVINQGTVTHEPRNVREIAVGNPGFNPDIFKQKPIIIGENRDDREISSEATGFYRNIPNLQEPIGGDRSVRDIDSYGSRTGKERIFDEKGDGNEEIGEGIDMKRESRSCKKKNSHHKSESSDKSIHEKPEPVRASLQMMNLKIVKSKDDSKFLDDATDNMDGLTEGKKKKKKICRVKHLHVLQPLKKSSKIVESPRKKEGNNLKNSTAVASSTFMKVLKATLDNTEGGEEEEEEGGGEGEVAEEDENEEKETEEEYRIRKDEEKEIDESRAKFKPAKKSKMNFVTSETMKDSGRMEGGIISSPLAAENVPKRVFGGTKKFVLSENHPQNYVPKNRKSLFKKDRFKNDDPTFLVGLEIKRNLKKEKEDDEGIGNSDGFDDDDDDDSSVTVEANIDGHCQTVAAAPSNFERLKLKDLKNFSEPINASDKNLKQSEEKLASFDRKLKKIYDKFDNVDNKLNNFDTNREKNIDKNKESNKADTEEMEEAEEKEEEEGEEEEGVEGEEENGVEGEDRGMKKRVKEDENGEREEENEEVGMENDEFEENADLGENDVNSAD